MADVITAVASADDGEQYRHMVKAKYNADQLKALEAAGKTFPGGTSFPIDDLEDLDNAIHAVGRGGADHDAIRAYIVRSAHRLNAMTKIPNTWNSDGSIKGETRSENFDYVQVVGTNVGQGFVTVTGPNTTASTYIGAVPPDFELLPARQFERTFMLDDISIRTGANEDGRTVVAYAAVFNDPAEIQDIDGHYLEVISPHAFDKTLQQRGINQVSVLFNHGKTAYGTPSDRYTMPIGTPLEIRPDGRGLYTVTRYSNTPLADEVLENIRNGAIRGQSFGGGFLKNQSKRVRGRSGDLDTITRNEAGLRDYGPTPFPAYSGAVMLSIRSDLVPDLQELADAVRNLTVDQAVELVDTLRTSGDPSLPAELAPAGTAAEPAPSDIDHGDASPNDDQRSTSAPQSPTYFERRQRLLQIKRILTDVQD